MKIGIIGTGYVGMVTAVCLAEMGNEVIGTDVVPEKIEKASRGIAHIYEPGLEELLKKSLKQGNLTFSHDLNGTVQASDVLFVCVNTPPKRTGVLICPMLRMYRGPLRESQCLQSHCRKKHGSCNFFILL